MQPTKIWDVFCDMGGVMCDFDSAIGRPFDRTKEWDPPEMMVKGFFRNLPIMPGAKEGIAWILEQPHLRLYIGSKPSTKNLYSTVEKYEWIAENFPPLLKRICLVCNKGLLRGDFLIDDDYDRWAGKFKGEFLHFDYKNPEASWLKVAKDLKSHRKMAEA